MPRYGILVSYKEKSPIWFMVLVQGQGANSGDDHIASKVPRYQRALSSERSHQTGFYSWPTLNISSNPMSGLTHAWWQSLNCLLNPQLISPANSSSWALNVNVSFTGGQTVFRPQYPSGHDCRTVPAGLVHSCFPTGHLSNTSICVQFLSDIWLSIFFMFLHSRKGEF